MVKILQNFCHQQYLQLPINIIQLTKVMLNKKKELISSLGTFNDNARLDDAKIKRVKTEIYNRQIYLTERVETWNDHVFQPKLLSSEFMNHPVLNEDPLFKEIKEVFIDYNKQVLGVETKIDQQHIRSKKMAELMKVMINVMEINNKSIQQKSLMKAHQWMKLNLKEAPDKYQSLKNYSKHFSPPKNVQLPKIPSNEIQIEARDYKQRMRTLHKHMYAPQDRIRYYKRRQLSFEDTLNIVPKKNKSQTKINKIKYIKPENDFDFGLQEEPVLEENLQDPTAVGIGADLQVVEQPVVQFDNAIGQQQQLQPEIPEEDDKVGKLNPKTKNYIFPDTPNYEKSEAILKQHFELQISKQQRQLRQDQQNQVGTRNFAGKKGRFQSQLSRKLQSIKQMAKMAKADKQRKVRSITEHTSYPVKNLCDYQNKTSILQRPFEQHSSHLTVKEVRKNVNHSLCFNDRQLPNSREGLSMIRRGKSQHDRKWLSLILKQNNSLQQKQQQLHELELVKQKLCQSRVPLQMRKLYQSLLKPCDLSTEELSSIGHPGGSLLSNPDFKVGKKKKKKRRK